MEEEEGLKEELEEEEKEEKGEEEEDKEKEKEGVGGRGPWEAGAAFARARQDAKTLL